MTSFSPHAAASARPESPHSEMAAGSARIAFALGRAGAPTVVAGSTLSSRCECRHSRQVRDNIVR